MDKTTEEIFDEIQAQRATQWAISDDLNYKTLSGAEVEFQLHHNGVDSDRVGRIVFRELPGDPSRSVPTIQTVCSFEGSLEELHLQWPIEREVVEHLVPLSPMTSEVRRFRLTQTRPWTCEGLPHSDIE